jgi:hypothetical protein
VRSPDPGTSVCARPWVEAWPVACFLASDIHPRRANGRLRRLPVTGAGPEFQCYDGVTKDTVNNGQALSQYWNVFDNSVFIA